MNNETLLMIFVAITGVAVLLQAAILLGIFLAVRKSLTSINEKVEELRVAALPALSDAKDLMGRVGPKLDSVATDMAALAHGLRAQSVALEVSATEILERVRRQTSRIDAMITGVLDSIDRAGGFVSHAVSVPVRQMSALAAAAKAIFGTLRTGTPAAARTHSAADKNMFV